MQTSPGDDRSDSAHEAREACEASSVSASPEGDQAELLVRFVSNRDVTCPACRYNLRGLTTARCPECRKDLALSVIVSEPPLVQFVLAVVGLSACGVTFGAVLCIVFAVSMVEGGLPPRGDAAMLLLVAPAIIVASDGLLVWRFMSAGARQRFAQRTRRQRWIRVGWCWLVSVVIATAWLVAVLNA